MVYSDSEKAKESFEGDELESAVLSLNALDQQKSTSGSFKEFAKYGAEIASPNEE